MGLYEAMFILNPDLGDEEREKVLSRFTNTISKNKGDLFRLDDLGMKSLAYGIEKKTRGRYFLAYIEGPGSLMGEMERFLRIDENVMRFLVIRQEDRVTRADLERKPEAPEEEQQARAGEPTENSEAGADNAG